MGAGGTGCGYREIGALGTESYRYLAGAHIGNDHRYKERCDPLESTVKGNLVVISVGSPDKVRPGDVYHLRRGATYVGQIMISRVEENQAVGEFDTQFPGAGGMPQNGDVAYTGNR